MYQHLDAALVRAPAWDARGLGLPWPDLTAASAAAAAWREWLDLAWQVPELASAVEAASPDLARRWPASPRRAVYPMPPRAAR